MKYEWVVARYRPNDPQYKTVLDNLKAGVGYFPIGDEKAGRELFVAFKRALDSPTPHHFRVINDQVKINSLEQRDRQRSGIPEMASSNTSDGFKKFAEIVDKIREKSS